MTCLFCQIAQGSLPCSRVFENEHLIAFNDINPQAPIHILIIPREHIGCINDLTADTLPIIAELANAAKMLAKAHGVDEDGYRLVINTNANGGQTVHHLHVHLLAGRALHWPPG